MGGILRHSGAASLLGHSLSLDKRSNLWDNHLCWFHPPFWGLVNVRKMEKYMIHVTPVSIMFYNVIHIYFFKNMCIYRCDHIYVCVCPVLLAASQNVVTDGSVPRYHGADAFSRLWGYRAASGQSRSIDGNFSSTYLFSLINSNNNL